MSRVIILTGDMLGNRMAGPAIRAFEMGRVLSGYHQVTISCPQINGPLPELPPNMHISAFGVEPRWADLNDYDAVVIPASLHLDAHFDTPLLVDLYDPFILSSLARTDKSEMKQLEELSALRRNLQRGDFFVCACERQRDFWLGMLADAGRVNIRQFQTDPHLNTLIQCAPFGIPAQLPVGCDWVFPGNPDDSWMVWAGGIWDWFDPLTAIQAVHTLNEKGFPVSLFFMGTSHPNPKMTRMTMAEQARNLARKLNLLDKKVYFGDWIPYSERGAVLQKATIGISTHYPHLETRFAYRTRILDYIWARLPFVCTDGDVFAEIVKTRQVGLAIAPEDVSGMVSGIERLLSDKSLWLHCKNNLENLAFEMTWEKVLAPVLEFCNRPARACDHGRPSWNAESEDEMFVSGCETAVAPAGEILASGIEQDLIIPYGGLFRIDLKLATYNRANTGYGIFELYHQDNHKLVSISFDLASVNDNHWHSFRFGPLALESETRLKVKVSCPVSRPGNAITAWMDSDCCNKSHLLNGKKQSGILNHRIYCRQYSGSDQTMPWRNRVCLRIPWLQKN